MLVLTRSRCCCDYYQRRQDTPDPRTVTARVSCQSRASKNTLLRHPYLSSWCFHLQAGETVTRALKRLGAQKAARPRPGKRQPSGGDGAQPQLSEEEQKAVQAQFDRLTEAASALMDSGDLDVYSQDKVRWAG